MRKLMLACVLVVLFASSCTKNDTTITVKGKVDFPDNRFKMEIYQKDGPEKINVNTFDLNPDGSYSFNMDVKTPGVYYFDCQKHQRVAFWAEDENVEINFRGQDTARIRMKNPPYVYIYGGPNNEVMNLLNFDAYRNYQMMVAISQNLYKGLPNQPDKRKEVSGTLYSALSDDSRARVKQIVNAYGDRNSIIAAVKRLNPNEDSALIESTLKKLEAKNPDYFPLVQYKKETKEKQERQNAMKVGQPAPPFEYAQEDGTLVGPHTFKGKLLLIDFWASWCGPCRSEIPNLKEVYEKHNEKGVEILSVSVDKSKDSWLKALKEETMPWTQLLTDDVGKKLMKDYQFSGIPFIVLLDREGTIIAKNLRGKALEEAIQKQLKK